MVGTRWIALVLMAATACAASVDLEGAISPTIGVPPTPAPSPAASDDGEAQPPPGTTLAAGQCFTATELADPEGTPVPCTESHIAEVFAVTTRPEPEGAAWPGLDVVLDDASDWCNTQFGEVMGVAGQLSALEILFFRPDEDTWARGDREVACFVQYPEDTSTPLAELDPMRAFGLVSTFALDEDDCVADESLVESVAVSLVDCSDLHWFEVFESAEIADGPYPGDEAVRAFVDDLCEPEFETFVGIPASESTLQLERLFPTEESWEQWDDRLVSCVITSDETRTGSAAGTGS